MRCASSFSLIRHHFFSFFFLSLALAALDHDSIAEQEMHLWHTWSKQGQTENLWAPSFAACANYVFNNVAFGSCCSFLHRKFTYFIRYRSCIFCFHLHRFFFALNFAVYILLSWNFFRVVKTREREKERVSEQGRARLLVPLHLASFSREPILHFGIY